MTTSPTQIAGVIDDNAEDPCTPRTPRAMPVTYDIGMAVSCADGPCGELSRVVIDPVRRQVTHLIVEPHHRHALSRLVPVGIAAVHADYIDLRCTRAQLADLQYATETEFVPVEPWMATGHPGDGVLGWPHYSYGPTIVVHERVPLGEVEIRRGEHIHASDGTIGRVHGLVVDAAAQHLTHVLVQEGHLWGRREVAIPIGALDRVDDHGVHVSLSKKQIGGLRPVWLDERPTR